MSTTATNPIDAISIGSTPAAPAISKNPGTSSPSKDGKGKPNDNQPIIHNITADSTLSLFPQAATSYPKLDDNYAATVTAVQTVEQPVRERNVGRKQGRKGKNAKGKSAAKSKSTKPGAKLLRLIFTLDHKRADGMVYSIEKDLRPKRAKDSKFGEFLKGILSDSESFDGFFIDFQPARLLNRRCTLQIKEARRKGQSSFKILDVLPAKVSTLGGAYPGAISDTVAGRINEPVELHAVAA